MRVGYRYIKYGNIKLDPSVYDSSLKERTNSPSARRHTADDLGLVLAELAWLQTLCDASLSQLTERVTITIRSIDGMRPILAERLAHQLRELWNDVGLEAKLERKTIDSNGPRGLTWQIELSGSLANLWANVEEGYHVVEDSQTVIPTLISLKIDSQPLSERIVRTCAPKFFDEGISDGIREQAKRSFYASLPAPLECLS